MAPGSGGSNPSSCLSNRLLVSGENPPDPPSTNSHLLCLLPSSGMPATPQCTRHTRLQILKQTVAWPQHHPERSPCSHSFLCLTPLSPHHHKSPRSGNLCQLPGDTEHVDLRLGTSSDQTTNSGKAMLPGLTLGFVAVSNGTFHDMAWPSGCHKSRCG